MTADVDALIASPELLAPLSQTDKNAWIFQVLIPQLDGVLNIKQDRFSI